MTAEPADTALPVIDISGLYGAPGGLESLAAAVGAACRGIGFFYVVGHRVPPELIAQAFALAAAFFSAPDAVKASAPFCSASNRGYIPFGREALDPDKPSDLKEAFNIGLDLAADDSEVLAGKPFRNPNVWPQLPGFRETMLAYFDAVWALGRDLHRAFATDLGIDQNFFRDKLDRPMATLRVLHYPPRPASIAAGQLGAGEHTDYGNITLLATDAVGGLEVRTRAGEWLKAPPVAGAFICNIGDCLMRWTNDIYVSTPHRVVSPAGRERYSIAFFLDPNPDAVVSCIPTCAGPQRPPRYAAVSGADYLRSRLDPTYASAARSAM
jgi:isopenicillin N synthase-like dioxygenase